jgi:predicted dehydrogenase
MKSPAAPSASPTRRQFLATGAVASGVLLLPHGLRGQGKKSPNERLRIALVGVGGRGAAARSGLAAEQFVALCDVDEKRGRAGLGASKKDDKGKKSADSDHLKDARWFKDFRVMFDTMGDQIDAVAIATPDHMHFPIAMAAIARKKHVYVEKPMCRCLAEVRTLHAAAKAAGVVTQMGNQGRAGEGIRLAREWVQAGLIGEVHTVHTWTDRPRLPWFHPADLDPDANAADTPVPPTLDWDLWLGVAPQRPYRPEIVPAFWRGFSAYGTGSLGDMGCHQLDAPFYALDLGSALSVEAATTKQYPKTFPASTCVTWKFPARSGRGPVEVKWFDGTMKPPLPVPGFKLSEGGGSLFYGTKGIMSVTSHSGSVRLLPEARMQEMAGALPPKTIPRVAGGPFQEWAAAIRGGPKPGSNFDYAAGLTEVVLLGVAAQRSQARLDWDAANARFPNRPDADLLVGPGYDYRPGFGV